MSNANTKTAANGGETKPNTPPADSGSNAAREVRILTAFEDFEVNQVVALDDKAAAAAVAAGLADDDAKAVAFAKALAEG